MLRFLTLSLVVSLSGCTAILQSFDRVSWVEMTRRLEYQGFSFERPPGLAWYLRRSEQDHTRAVLRRDLRPESPTHTFYAQVSLGRIDRQPDSHEEFAELARSKGQKAPYEIERVSYEQRLVTRQNQWCIQFASVDLSRGAPVAPDQELTLVLRGFRCLHPTFPETTVDLFYSERGLADEIDENLYGEAEAFLEGVRIDVAPGEPAS